MSASLHLVVPAAVRDPARPSGGNTYDRELAAALSERGWSVRERVAPGDWPTPDDAALAGLAAQLGAVPDGARVLVDGLVASAAAPVLVPAAARVRLSVLVHLPLGGAQERRVLRAAHAVITTSGWTREHLLTVHDLSPARVHVARPGVAPAPPACGTGTGGSLLCLAAVVPAKGHATLLAALASLSHLPWHLTCAGALDLDPDHVVRLRAWTAAAGLADRVRWAGPLGGPALEETWAGTDLLVHPSRGETYAMVLAEALARAVPVVATDVGGVREAVGTAADGRTPGRLVRPDEPEALADAVRGWLTDPARRRRWRDRAEQRRTDARGWAETAADVARALERELAAAPVRTHG